MASLYFTDGYAADVKPANGTAFTLKELQTAVCGYIEAIPLRDGRVLVVNEEGKLRGMPTNAPASLIVERLSDIRDVIVGPALLCTCQEMGEGS